MRIRTRAQQLLWVVFALACGLLVTRAIARACLFPRTPLAGEPPPPDVLVHRALARDGTPVRALELRAPAATRTIVHFHNNRQTADGLVDVARLLRDRGLDVVLAEYRGYGASPGTGPTEEGLYDDAEAILDILAARGVRADRITLWGTSLGTGVAAEMARRGRGSRLVLVSPYTSIPDLVQNAVPLLPAGIMVPDHFDTRAKASAIRVSTLVVHGDADEIVPFWMGEALSRAIPTARMVRVRDGHHADVLWLDQGRALAEIAEFAL